MAASGRPRAFDEAEALDRAVHLFWGKGFRDTTTRDLESALGISASSLYHAYGSKQGLFDAALDRYEVMAADALVVPLERDPRGLEALDRFFDGLVGWVSSDGRAGCMVINLMSEDGGRSPVVAARTEAFRSRVVAALSDALRRAAAAGETDAAGLQERAHALFGIALAVNLAARGGAAKRELDALVGAGHYLLESWRS